MFRSTLALFLLCVLCPAEVWPTYRHDNRRSGVSPSSLQLPLTEAWVHNGGLPQQAWTGPAKWDAYSSNEGLQSMRNFDPCYFTTASHNLIYYGSSSDNALHCLDASTGEEQWQHFTNSSVRFPPTLVGEQAWFGSDDGYIYCANALTGKTLWKKQAAPSDRLIPSNGKLISPWPVRTGITVENGRAFFAASLLPWKTSYLWCINAKTAERAYLTE
ncbi:PQQ-binding-like beta-propeller repeat protein, partial [Akkermansiaceae bacterium]|nr:PQQ-binding-like beta-propeller repeat protein [Akkermansiaceae bacterium]